MLGMSVWIPLEILHWSLESETHGAWLPWVMFGGSTLAVILVGQGFFTSALRALRRGGTNMDTLVALGTSIAYAYSVLTVVYGMLHPASSISDQQVFETAAMLISFLLLGKYLEARARGKATEAITRLLSLQPSAALLCDCVHDMDEEPREAAAASFAARPQPL